MANSNQKRPVKKIKVVEDDDVNHHSQEQVVCHDFWNEAPEELLTEIFVRLVDSRLAARASTVCRRWHSSIRLNPRQFIERFKSHHPPEYSLPWAVVFRPDRCSEANICHVYSDEWLFLHRKLPDNCFDFLPNSSNMQIKASCNDLFLLASHKNKNDLYICNPITKQFVQLPAGPRVPTNNQGGVQISYAVVRTPPGPTTTNIVRFKVVRVLVFPCPNNRRGIVPVAVFCSVSRKWETRSFPCPGLDSGWYNGYNHYDIVTVDGVLYYWLSRLDQSEMILMYLDLSKDKCGTIRTPWPKRTYIGAVSNEFRLLEVDSHTEGIVHLKVWRFNNNNNNNNNDNNWILVHGKRTLARPECLKVERSSRSKSFAGAFVHPTNGDLVLCVWGKIVMEYNLVDSTCKKIAELSMINDWTGLRPPFLMVGDSDLGADLDF